MDFPEPVIGIAVEPKTQKDMDKLSNGLALSDSFLIINLRFTLVTFYFKFTFQTVNNDIQVQLILESMDFPEPVIGIAVEPKTQKDMDKLSNGLAKLAINLRFTLVTFYFKFTFQTVNNDIQVQLTHTRDYHTGDTLCDETAPIVLESMDFPEPVIGIAVEPKTVTFYFKFTFQTVNNDIQVQLTHTRDYSLSCLLISLNSY